MTPPELVAAALEVAEGGMAAGELPIGAVVAMGGEVVGLESPGDGAAAVAASWQTHPDTPWLRAPVITGGILRGQARDQFRRYGQGVPESGLRRWARTLADQPD